MTFWNLINMNKSLPDWKIPDNYLKIKYGISLPLNQNNEQNQNDEFDLVDLDSTSKSGLDLELDNTLIRI